MCIILEEGSATILSLVCEGFVTSIGLGHWGPWHGRAHVTPSLTAAPYKEGAEEREGKGHVTEVQGAKSVCDPRC